MISKKMSEEINKQINEELYSAYLYLSMSAWFASKNLMGFANWMRIQFQEEEFHAFKMFDYLLERGGQPELKPIDGPKTDWKDAIEIFEDSYNHEQHITSRINHMINVAYEEKDHAAITFLQWFVNEQVEEEANASGMLEQLKLIDGKGPGLFMLDREAKSRVFNPPVNNQ